MIIGIIGPKDSSESIANKLIQFDKTIKYKLYIREEISKVTEVIDKCEEEVDGIILTGIGVNSCLEKVKVIKKPYVYIERNSHGFTSVLWKAKKALENSNNFSVDVVTNEVVQEVREELELSDNYIETMPFSPLHDEKEYVSWHKHLFDEGKTHFIVTGFGSVYSHLKAEGYPVYRMMPTYSQVKDAYKELLHKSHILELKSSQIAIQIIKFNKKTTKNYYEELNTKNQLEKEIISYVREVQGALYSTGSEEFIISGTRGSFKDSINNFMKLLSSIKIEIHSGIGYGNTAYEADTNARTALVSSINIGGLFISDENKNIIGPFNKNNIKLNKANQKVEIISVVTKLSPIYISKLMTLFNRRKELKIDSKEMAGYLDISERSARRIINKLIESNYGTLEIEETLSKGRPRNIIKIDF